MTALIRNLLAIGLVLVLLTGAGMIDHTEHVPNLEVATNAVVQGALTVNGRMTNTVTDTTSNNTRPVLFPMTYSAAPGSTIGVGTDFHGVDLIMSGNTANATANSRIYPLEVAAQWSGTTALGGLYGGQFGVKNTSSGAVTTGTGVRISNRNTGGGSFATLIGLRINAPVNTGGSTISDNYGLFVDAQTGGSLNYDIYSPGHNNLFGASRISAASDPGWAALRVSQAHTSAWPAADIASSGAYGQSITTSGDSGTTLLLTKNGTGAGVVEKIVNKGTGNSLEIGDGTSTSASFSSSGELTLANLSPGRLVATDGSGKLISANRRTQIYLYDPTIIDGVGCTRQGETGELAGRATYSGSASPSANWAKWTIIVPFDIDTTQDLRVEYFKFVLLGDPDTASHTYKIAMFDGADSATADGTYINEVTMTKADSSGELRDLETIKSVTLTNWKGSLTPGDQWIVKVARDGAADASTGGSVVASIILSYVSNQ